MNEKELSNLTDRANKAFDSSFRIRLENAVQNYVSSGGKISNFNLTDVSCKCPEGCLTSGHDFPSPQMAAQELGFEVIQHHSFQRAFDIGYDDKTPEAALGILYRLMV